MPRISNSLVLPTPLRVTDRIFVERNGVAPYEISMSAIIDLVAEELAKREDQKIPIGAVFFDRGYLVMPRGTVVIN